jgi:WD40 repeat protein/serine/threonine protein kinase
VSTGDALEREIFEQARNLMDSVARSKFLDQSCGTDAILRQRLEALLRAHDAKSGFMEQPAFDPRLSATAHPPAPESPGTRIGPYKLLELIGAGGMGAVWMAEQEHPVRRRVALKIIKPGMDSAQVIARFEAERQALALMDHPNIARVLDVGTTEQGRPYFVMELVKGISIAKYCEQGCLTPRQRLELFIPVCQAIQHAHQKGIIHRDIKPSNVLVASYDGHPVPKVIDFGVVKAIGQQLTDRTLFTGFGGIVGTLEYMSPEQAEFNALDIDTRSDIYSLGVLLYELLTGSTPLTARRIQEAGLIEVLRVIREEDAPSPSTRLSTSESLASISAQCKTEPQMLMRIVRGELDWIVMRALDKNRARRYETANALGQDIQRYLSNEPVEACPPSTAYRLRKFASKHKSVLATAAAFVLVLTVATFVSVWLAIQATTAMQLANEARENELENLEQANRAREQALNAEALATRNAQKAQQEAERADAKAKEVQKHLYVDTLHLVQSAWENHDDGQVNDYLKSFLPQPGQEELRGFEWYYWNRLLNRDLRTFARQNSHFTCVAYAPDGKRMASGAGDGSAVIWNPDTGTSILALPTQEKAVRGIAFSPDGTRVIMGTEANNLLVCNASTGHVIYAIPGHTKMVCGVACSPDGAQVATASEDQTVKLWDLKDGSPKRTLTGHTAKVTCVAFSPDGGKVASASDDSTVRIWDAATGDLKQTLTQPDHPFTSVAFSPDGSRLAAATGLARNPIQPDPNFIHVWDVATGKEVVTLTSATGDIFCFAFHPKGDRIVSGSRDQVVRLWDLATGQKVQSFHGHAAYVNGVAFSPDGHRIASVGGNYWSEAENTIKIWDADDRAEPITLPSSSYCVAFTPDGRRIAAYDLDESTITLWDAVSGTKVHSLKEATGDAEGLAISPDGKLLATGAYDGGVRLWNAETGDPIRTFPRQSGWISGLTFSPDGTYLAVAGRFGGVTLLNVKSGAAVANLAGSFKSSMGVSFNHDGKLLASAHGDGTVRIWDVQTACEIRSIKAHSDAARSVAFHPNGVELATASDDHTVKIWNSSTGELVKVLNGHREKVICVVYTPDGSRLASASWDGTVKVWSPVTGLSTLTLRGHNSMVTAVMFSPDGTRLASAGYDGTVKIWEAPRIEK